MIPYIEKLLDGQEVQWKTLGEVAKIKRGTSITQKNATAGVYPVISGGQKPAYYVDEYNREGKTITVAGSGAYAGFVMFWDEPIFIGDAFSIQVDSSKISLRYIYHFLLSMQEMIHRMKSGSGVPHVYPKDVARIQIPLPPLSVQEEIVRVLDLFTELEAELEAELVARKKQYEYYRNSLLSFDKPGGGGKIMYKNLGEVFEIRNGYTPSKRVPEYWKDGDIPWFRMEDLRTYGGILDRAIQNITAEGVKKSGLFKAGSIILATTASIGEHALLAVDGLANQQLSNFQIKKAFQKLLLPKYTYYYFFIIDEWCKKNTKVSSFPSVDMERLKKVIIPIPPLEEQERIVRILDQFDTLTSSLSEGLPKEIELRRKQYTYYREQLLSFPRH